MTVRKCTAIVFVNGVKGKRRKAKRQDVTSMWQNS